MKRKVTSWTREWRELILYKARDVVSGVKVVLEKKDHSYIIVYLDGLCVPTEYMYINDSLCEYEPDDYDGTEEDKKIKIDGAIAKAEKIYNDIEKGQIIDLQDAINEHNILAKRIRSIIDHIKLL